MQDGFHLVSLKGKMKHNSISLDWCMGDFGTMPMKCFCFTSPAWPKCVGPTTWLDARDSSLLINKISEDMPVDIASMLSMPEEELPYYPKPVGKKQTTVPRISIPKEDVLNLRFPLTKGIFLVGFKPLSWIQESWQLRESYFMRPGMPLSSSLVMYTGIISDSCYFLIRLCCRRKCLRHSLSELHSHLQCAGEAICHCGVWICKV